MNNNTINKETIKKVLTILSTKKTLNNNNKKILNILDKKPSRSVKPTHRNILKDENYIATQKAYVKKIKNITKKTKRKRSHGRSKRLLKSTRNTLKRQLRIGMKKIKVSKETKSREELKQNMIFVDYDEFKKEFKSNLDFFRNLNQISTELSNKGYSVAMITSKDTLSVPKDTERSFFMSNLTSPNNNSNNNNNNNNNKAFVNIEDIILVSTSDNIKKFKERLSERNLLSISNPSMIIVNNHNGIKILKNLINDEESRYPPFTLDSNSFNNSLKTNRLLESVELNSKSTISTLIKKGMINNLRNTKVNDIVMLSINDKKGTVEDSFLRKQNDDYSLCLFLNLNQLENIMSVTESKKYKLLSEYMSLLKSLENNNKLNDSARQEILNRLGELNNSQMTDSNKKLIDNLKGKERRERERRENAATKIQTVFRGHRKRKNTLKREYVDISQRILKANELGEPNLSSEERIQLQNRRSDIRNKLDASNLKNVNEEIQKYLGNLQTIRAQGLRRNM
jgi:hypothetical protein